MAYRTEKAVMTSALESRSGPFVCFPRIGPPGAIAVGSWDEPSREVAEAAAELLQVLCCGEESAVIAFEGISRNQNLTVAGAVCAEAIAREEEIHDELLRGLRAALPAPRQDVDLQHKLKRFYRSLAARDCFVHLTQICALDSAVCIILSALREPGRPIAGHALMNRLFGRILRDEIGHVRASGYISRQLGPSRPRVEHFVRTRESLIEVIWNRAEAFATLEVDPDSLKRRLTHVPKSLS